METESTRHREDEAQGAAQGLTWVFLLIFVVGIMGSAVWRFYRSPETAPFSPDSTAVSFPSIGFSFSTIRAEQDIPTLHPASVPGASSVTPRLSTQLTPVSPVKHTARRTVVPGILNATPVLAAAQLNPVAHTTRLTQEVPPSPREGISPLPSLQSDSLEAGAASQHRTHSPQIPQVQASSTRISGLVQSGQTALGILTSAGMSVGHSLDVLRTVKTVYDFQRVRIGHRYIVLLSPSGVLERFTYDISANQRFIVRPQGNTFVGNIESIPVQYSERTVAGQIEDSIYVALTSQGESPRLVQDFVDIFSWRIDMTTDIHSGDTFRLLIQDRSHEGQQPEYHRILAAELVNQGTVWQAIYFESDESGEYYRPDGSSLRGMFLRTPLQYTRISSHFSRRRLHPILKRYRPHWGIDYAAPTGTPVRSVGNGVVKWVGHKGQNGKMVKIKHDSVYTSYYLHLSGYAKGIKRGVRVEQGQLIGYVGATGLATGPHLDFRISKRGHYINPLTHDSIEAPPISRKVLPAFRMHAGQQLAKLQELPPQRIASTNNGQNAGR